VSLHSLRRSNLDVVSREVFFADERLVPLDHPDSTFAAYDEALFSKVPIPAWQIHSVKSLHELSVDPVPLAAAEEIAADYEAQLLASFPDVNGPGTLALSFKVVVM
jgi:6-phosphogluconolactonase